MCAYSVKWCQEKVLSARPRPRTWALPSRAVTTGSERCGVAVVRAESALLLTATGLRGGGPLVSATRARPVLLSVVPLLALRRRARRRLLLDRDDTERVGRRLRPVALLAVLLVGAGLLRASDGDDCALDECGVLGVATEQGHVVEGDPAVLPLLGVTVELPEVLGNAERCTGLTVVAVLDLRVSGETALKSDLCQSVSPVCFGCDAGVERVRRAASSEDLRCK